jgi:phage replication initiation protein
VLAEIDLDFMTFTVKGGVSADSVIADILKMDIDLFDVGRGYNFYHRSKSYDNITVLFDGFTATQGICVNLSGQGCRNFESYHTKSMFTFLTELFANPLITVTRLDICADDRVGSLDLTKMWTYLQEGKYRTRMTTKTFHESFSGETEGARTIYIGSPSSLYRVRIYDKAKQLFDPATETDLFNSHWVRFEIVLRNEYAVQSAAILAATDNLDAAVAGIISDKFNFIERTDENISRCILADWWIDFLEGTIDIKLSPKPKNKHVIERHADWLKFAISRTLSKVHQAMGDIELNELLKQGKEKLTDSDLAQIDNYKRRIGACDG